MIDRFKSERECLLDCRENCCNVWFKDGGTVKKTVGRAEDVKVSVLSEQGRTKLEMRTQEGQFGLRGLGDKVGKPVGG